MTIGGGGGGGLATLYHIYIYIYKYGRRFLHVSNTERLPKAKDSSELTVLAVSSALRGTGVPRLAFQKAPGSHEFGGRFVGVERRGSKPQAVPFLGVGWYLDG